MDNASVAHRAGLRPQAPQPPTTIHELGLHRVKFYRGDKHSDAGGTKWGRTRSGCYFCFYQQKIEWVRLKETYPELYEEAKNYERPFEKTGNEFTWSRGESLAELERPERVEQIKREHVIRIQRQAARKENATLMEVFATADSIEEPDDDDDQGCIVCQL